LLKLKTTLVDIQQKVNTIPASMTNNNDKNANTTPGVDTVKAIADPRLKSVVTLIETQLTPVKEVLADFAKAMLDNTIALENRIKSFKKYSSVTNEDNIDEPQEPPQDPPQDPNALPSFIPRSARVKLELSYSKALANDTAINDLKKELELCKREFTTKVTKIFGSCAEIEMIHCKEERIKTFLSYTMKITKALTVFERIETPLATSLNSIQFSIKTITIFLRKIRYNILIPGELNFFRDYLKTTENEVREILFRNFVPLEQQPYREIERGESEINFQDIISDKLINLILPITTKLQATIEKENKIKKAAYLLSAEFKKTEILSATEATAIAVENTSTANITLEQHIKKLIEEAVKKQTSTSSKKQKQKNSPGSKTPQPSLPNTTKGSQNGKRNANNKRKSPPNKAQKNPTNNTPPQKKARFNQTNTPKKQNPTKTQKPHQKGKNKTRNAQDHQGEKKTGGKRGRGKNPKN